MKLIVSDFDGTFFDGNLEENIKLVNDFVNDNNIFAFATGRNISNLKKDIDISKIKYHYMICNDGATIYDKNGNLEKTTYMNQITASKIFNFLNKQHNTVSKVRLDLGGSYTTEVTDNIVSIIARYSDQERAQNMLDDLLVYYPDVYGYLSTEHVNINSRETSKGLAIKYLAEKLNIAEENIYTIGDHVNDISMNRRFQGYAVKNSTESLKKVSIAVVPSFKKFMEEVNESTND